MLQRGNFSAETTDIVAGIIKCYSFSFCFLAIRDVLVRIHIAYSDTRTPTINGAIGVVINVILSVILSKIVGINGIALATSISVLTVAAISFFTVKKHLQAFPFDKIGFIELIKTIGVIVFTIISCKCWTNKLDNVPIVIRVILKLFGAWFIYFGMSKIIRIQAYFRVKETILKLGKGI